MKELSYRVKEILSSVVLFTSPNETDNTTDCYLKYKNDHKRWVAYNETEFFDTLSFCLDSTIGEDGIYVRQYKNIHSEIIKLENATIINKENFIAFLNFIRNTGKYLNEDIHEAEKLIRKTTAYQQRFKQINKEWHDGFDSTPLGNYCYDEIKRELRAINKNINEIFVEDQIDNNDGSSYKYDQPKIISRASVFKCLNIELKS